MNYFFDNLQHGPLTDLANAMMNCKGVIFFSGIGKSGFIAQKISMTLVSTGTKAVFLNPVDALHGDIGILEPQDMLILFSKSRSTEELLKLCPFAKAKGATLVSATCIPGNKLEKACDMAVTLPLERELCPFDLAPVTSTAIQMLFGDTLAIALMEAKGLTKTMYAMNHPAGRIGKRLILNVVDVMDKADALPLVREDAKVMEVLIELSSKGKGCVLAVDGAGDLKGTFTDGDLRRALQSKGAATLEMPVGELMTKTPRTVTSEMKAAEAMDSLEMPNGKKISFLPVLEGTKVVGLVTLHGLVAAGL